jgi:hypothetical protein
LTSNVFPNLITMPDVGSRSPGSSITNMQGPSLFTPLTVGGLTLRNRIIVARG